MPIRTTVNTNTFNQIIVQREARPLYIVKSHLPDSGLACFGFMTSYILTNKNEGIQLLVHFNQIGCELGEGLMTQDKQFYFAYLLWQSKKSHFKLNI